MTSASYDQLDRWIDAHFDEQVRLLQELVRVPTDTPPGNNTPHAHQFLQQADLFVEVGVDPAIELVVGGG